MRVVGSCYLCEYNTAQIPGWRCHNRYAVPRRHTTTNDRPLVDPAPPRFPASLPRAIGPVHSGECECECECARHGPGTVLPRPRPINRILDPTLYTRTVIILIHNLICFFFSTNQSNDQTIKSIHQYTNTQIHNTQIHKYTKTSIHLLNRQPNAQPSAYLSFLDTDN